MMLREVTVNVTSVKAILLVMNIIILLLFLGGLLVSNNYCKGEVYKTKENKSEILKLSVTPQECSANS